MKKEKPEDKNKIRRRSVNSSNSRRSASDRKSESYSGQDIILPSERAKASSSTDNRRRSSSTQRKSSTNNSSKTRSVSASARSENNTKNERRTNTSKNLKKKRKTKKKRKIIAFIIAFFIVITAAGLGLVFASLKDVKPVNETLLDKMTHQTTTIKFANGETMSMAPTLYKKTPIPLSDISPYLRKAIVSIEDERFYSHSGVDYWGLGRSTIKTLAGSKQGGSTIPMQVSKMLLTSSDQTISRKIKDIYYALEMNKTVSKDKLLETYLNNYFVGKGLCGAEAGARGYFNKGAKDLTLAESAMLAGVTRNPSKYAPYSTARITGDESRKDLDHKLLFFMPSEGLDAANGTEKDMYEKLQEWDLVDNDTYKQLKAGDLVIRKAINNPEAKKRQETVLKKMKDLNVITEKQYVSAVNERIDIQFPDDKEEVANSVESLIEYDVIDALMEQGKTESEARNMYYNGGLIINSTIDPKIQKVIERQYSDASNFPNNTVTPNGLSQPQSASVIIDYKTGNIKGLIGGRNIKARKTLNRAITPFQPGSTIKPLSVYTPAIDTQKVTQSTLMSDVRGGYRFKENRADNPNTTTSGSGSMSLRRAVATSSNTIAYKTGELLGPTYDDSIDVMMDYLRNFGITTILDFKEENKAGMKSSDRHFNSLVLGGLTRGVSPLQMAAAFGTLANGGIYVEPQVFTTVTSYNGEIIVKNTPKTHKVVDPEVAYVMTDMLKAVVTEGIGKNAAISNMPVAGKTGSTNSYLDTWFVGYTPYYVGSVYIGDDAGIKKEDGTTVERRPIEGGAAMSSAKLWGSIMSDVHENLEYKDFNKPDKIYMTTINPMDGGRTSFGVSAAFIDGTAPDRYSYTGFLRKKKTTTKQQNPQTQDGTLNNNGNGGLNNNHGGVNVGPGATGTTPNPGGTTGTTPGAAGNTRYRNR
ncbi:transglycosylase domain-containing protein [Peptostreptococcus equinus]|uniref:Penicillin-binding protein 1A n=1 Tax=Peptostreptococcus equinus TaxID=3003601 RepID=A0ABY7JPA7_9FIRM|nr:transglycosylase domain-containing protein [Peptostreptococcus sp. CBA3647]WAW15205.1 transglycosylase domain-containing protein [Peptostreptococcus sp. CBA3647]